MERLIRVMKVVFIAIVEGVSEWLPISSSGHMLLLDEFINLDVSNEFKEVFFVVIQLGAIFSVIVLFWKRLFPFFIEDNKKFKVNKDIVELWKKVIVACTPGAIVALLLDELVEIYLHGSIVISLMLIIYGVVFLFINKIRPKTEIEDINSISYKTAFYIGCFQILAIIPGTSRSGATIVGAMLMGLTRIVAAEFTFYLAVPVMLGYSALKLIKFGFIFSIEEIVLLVIGMLIAFVVSLVVIKKLMKYIKEHDFKIFGIYRVLLGIIILFCFL